MANRYKNLIYSNAEYTHSYGSFKGIELNAGSLISSPSRLAYSENMYKDYDGDGADVLESIPGFRCFANYGKTVHALYYQRSVSGDEDHLIVHVGDKLMRHPVSDIHLENSVGVEIATVMDTKSFGFEYGRFFYVMDTVSIFRIDSEGECKKVGDDGALPYVPTIYVSGEAYEQRNLLTKDFKEEFYIADPSMYLYKTEGLRFTITDPYLHYCCVSGITDSADENVYLPAYVNIAGTEYKVTAIGDYAFYDNRKIKSVNIAHGISEIGKRAFMSCDALKSVSISSTVTKIGSFAFANCTKLESFYLGSGVETIEENVFMSTSMLKSVNYALTDSEFKKITGYDRLDGKSIVYNSTVEKIKISLFPHDEIEGISSVSVDGVSASFELVISGEHPIGATLEFDSITEATGVKIILSGALKELNDDWASDMTTLSVTSPYEAVTRCTTAEIFDGRVFFSGNPNFPNTVFYTERAKTGQDGALSVGRYNYFNDGVGAHKVTSMLAVRDMLAVFKEGDDGSGSIFYHKKEATTLDALDTIYPVAYVHSGICSKGGCLSFFDDPVFLTNEGLMALNSENINYQRNVVCRSHNVNYTLLKSDLSKASLCEWLGYLVVGLGDTVLLADSRSVFKHPTGSYEYEWFLLSGIGAHTGGHIVYRYASEPFSSAKVHPTLVGKVANYKDVMSVRTQDGARYYCVRENNSVYRVIPTVEMAEGKFHPASVFISHGKLLFFATDNGQICVFNNDMRGVAPEDVRNSEDFDEEEYLASMGNRIHPSYYTFDRYSPRYVVKTALDNCGIPHLTKNSVKKSLIVKAKSYSPDVIKCEVITDGGDPVYVGNFPPAVVGFDDFNFMDAPWNVARYTSVALSEKEKRWIEKQILLTAEEFEAPISIYSISYRYVIQGKIKNNA